MAAAEGLLRCVFEGCLAASDMGKERRPYHRNCGCALHGKKRCTRVSNCNTISYPIRRCSSESCLVMAASSSSSSPPSTVSSLATERRSQSQAVLCRKEESDNLWRLEQL